MQIQINQVSNEGGTKWVDATCGKTNAWIAFSKHGVQVCCKNAAHRAWGGMGKRFDSAEAAKSNYRSAEMKAIIEAAEAA